MKKSLITQAGYEKLQLRLIEKNKKLKQIREEKAHAYSASGDGWHDNPGWIQLGQQEEMISFEISILQQKLSNATIIDSSRVDMTKVQVGSKVEILMKRKDGSSNIQILIIGGSGESDVKNRMISYDSPMGTALCNMKVNEEKDIELPIGLVTIKIRNITYE